MDSFYQRAYAMMSSDNARAAFDLKRADNCATIMGATRRAAPATGPAVGQAGVRLFP